MGIEAGRMNRRDLLKTLAATAATVATGLNVQAGISDRVLMAQSETFSKRVASYLKSNHHEFIAELKIVEKQYNSFRKAVGRIGGHMHQEQVSFYSGPAKDPQKFANVCMSLFDEACLESQCAPLSGTKRDDAIKMFIGLAEHLGQFADEGQEV